MPSMAVTSLVIDILWRTHIYIGITVLVLYGVAGEAELLGYVAAFLAATITSVGILLLFRSGLTVYELLVPVAMYGGVVYVLVDYFYVSGRTLVYLPAMYATIVSLIETVRFLYRESAVARALSTFALLSHLYAAVAALGVWFFTDYFTNVAERTQLVLVLLLYAFFGVVVEGLQTIAERKLMSQATANTIFGTLFVIVFGIALIALLLTYMYADISGEIP